jgi:hypothetical protein
MMSVLSVLPACEDTTRPKSLASHCAVAHLHMVQPIEDCEALVTRGMSWSARECPLDVGVRPILTDIEKLDEAVNAYLDGTIVDHTELLH